ncbi:SOS-response transcriptional regulator UmuD-like protein [Dyadobacter frigoris]|uniref:LexA family protein n=1 Tax=Dyadobacter frigoris TaxID=2576211 RepID=UPI0024A52088|nr:translesion error-prone DNA polymerase V autoproteolytic subunit [Dyadobacter frigoris]GLU56516.1 SOS-response transcriptional regulator UmuD-like protein [Dyadobacter frigoris]
METEINFRSQILSISPYINSFGELHLPYFLGLKAGFPSPAADFIDVNIDLIKELVKNPSSTFLGKVMGNSMKDVGIDDSDILIIDKSLEFEDNCIAVAFINGEFTVKRIKRDKEALWLLPANKNYAAIKIEQNDEFTIWGIVVKIIKDVKNVRTS